MEGIQIRGVGPGFRDFLEHCKPLSGEGTPRPLLREKAETFSCDPGMADKAIHLFPGTGVRAVDSGGKGVRRRLFRTCRFMAGKAGDDIRRAYRGMVFREDGRPIGVTTLTGRFCRGERGPCINPGKSRQDKRQKY